MKYTVVQVTDWCSLWRGDDDGPFTQDEVDVSSELVYEGHDLTVSELAEYADQDGYFTLEVIDGVDTDADREVSQGGGFRGISLGAWRERAGRRS